MKTLGFVKNLVPLVLSGEKTITWRLFNHHQLGIGDQISLVNSDSREEFAQAEIIKIDEKKMGEIEDKDFDGHEKFKNKEEMIATYGKYYYPEKVNENTLVKIIKFKLL